jgi:hypothetical protein
MIDPYIPDSKVVLVRNDDTTGVQKGFWPQAPELTRFHAIIQEPPLPRRAGER